MPRITRHTLYYRLMDVSFLGLLLVVIDTLLRETSRYQLFPAAFDTPFSIAGLTCLIIPALLIFQRWMRDDFSEMLWQRTAGTVLKLLVLLPVPAAIAAGLAMAAGQDGNVSEVVALDHALDPLTNAMMYGMVRALVYLWILTPMLFTFAFQWHRWRASR